MLRFDPTRAEHTKFVEAKKRKAPKQKDDQSNNKRFKNDYANEDEQNVPEVSTEHFFKVSDRLKSSIGQSTGFSLMQMFGRSNTDTQADDSAGKLKQSRYEEIPIATNVAKGLANLNPFSYDSSDGEEDNDKKAGTKTQNDASAKPANKKIWQEPFFMLAKNDARFTGIFTQYIDIKRNESDMA